MLQRIRYFRAQKTTNLQDLVQSQLQLSTEHLQQLLRLGAVYQNETRIFDLVNLKAGDVIRLHLQPKRFNLADFNLQKNLLAETTDYVILNKPSGLPSGPSLDNYFENLLKQTELHLQQNLWLPHRLDIGTSGLICLAKNPEFASWFAQALERRRVEKFYQCLSQGLAPQLGMWTHWMRKSTRAPKILSREATQGWLSCQLKILSSQEIQPGVYFNTLQLLTGRTHQIRAQLAFEGSPIVADHLYQSGRADSIETFALHCSELSFQFQGQSYQYQLPSPFSK